MLRMGWSPTFSAIPGLAREGQPAEKLSLTADCQFDTRKAQRLNCTCSSTCAQVSFSRSRPSEILGKSKSMSEKSSSFKHLRVNRYL